MEIHYTKAAVKVINSLDRTMKQRIKNGIEGLTWEPPVGDIKQIQGVEPSLYRLRVGKYRVLFVYTNIYEKQVLLIKDIGSRGDIYK